VSIVSDADEDLVRRAVDGDRSAFTQLMERHERRVYNLCLRMVGDIDDASDATQDTFLTAYRRLSSFRGEAAFTTWLHRVAVNASYDLLRKRGRAPVLTFWNDRVVEEERVAPAPDHADETTDAIEVQRALLAIPEEFRAALVLHDAQDVPVQQVADILGVPVGTVKSRLHRGRVALARALGVGEPEQGDRSSKGRIR
jgi:RNA polymerase sigma-70 factor (ECF subfamily)